MNKNKLFFSSFVSMLIIFPCMIEISSATIVTHDWLYVNVNDPDPNDKLNFYPGGTDLYFYNNLGVQQIDDVTGIIMFGAKFDFGVEVGCYTSLNLDDIFINMNPVGTQRYEFLNYRTFGFFNELTWDYHYYTTYNCLTWDSINSNHYNEYPDITLNLNPDFQNFNGATISGITIDTAEYLWTFKEITVSNVSQNEIGIYEDIYEEPENIDVSVNIVRTDDSVPSAVLDFVASRDLGALTVDRETITYQNEILHTTPKGKVYSNTNPGAFTFRDQFEIRPRVDITRRQIRNRYCWLDRNTVWNFDTLRKSGTDLSPEIPFVIQNAHVSNYYIHKDYRISCVILATMELDFEKYESKLSDPFFIQGDWVWSSMVGGTESIDIAQHQSWWEDLIDGVLGFFGNLFGGIFWIFIGIIAIIVVIKVIPKIIRKRRENRD